MERRRVLAGICVLALSSLMLAGSAYAHTAHKSKKLAPAVEEEVACKVIAQPGRVIDTGVGSIAAILEVECRPAYAGRLVRIASNGLWDRCHHRLDWTRQLTESEVRTAKFEPREAKETRAELDADGNVEVLVTGGPGCAAEGGALVTANLEPGTQTFTTEVVVEPPKPTKPGIHLYPEIDGKAGAIESATDGSVLGLAVIDLPPGDGDGTVDVTDQGVLERCQLKWLGVDAETLAIEIPEALIKLVGDDAFVAISGERCKPGETVFEMSLEEPPFTSVRATFDVFPPQSNF